MQWQPNARDGEPTGRRPRFENLTLWQRVYDHLRAEILADRLPPGTRAPGGRARRSSSASAAGPVREAIGRLASEGLVTVRPRRGAVVRSLSKEEFLEAYQVREALEMMAVRLAVPRLRPEDLGRLQAPRRRDDRPRRGGRGRGVLRRERRFPRRVRRRVGQRGCSELYRQLLDQIGRYRIRSLELRGNLHRSVAEHAAILRAAKRGDAERAAHLMSEHIRVPQRRLRGRSDEESADGKAT